MAAMPPSAGAEAQSALTTPIASPGAGGAAELLLYQDLPVVISGSRQAQPINLSSVPVSIITADEIHYSGLTTLPDILFFAPGVDVLKIDRNNYAVGVRGLAHPFLADRTLTLINGRNAGSPVWGGADFMALPVLVEDIDRIEVVRGPAGAAWGANAFNGAINIITKSPEESRGVFASSTVDQVGDTYTHVRWADVAGPWSWRISAGYEDRKSSADALGDAHLESTMPEINFLMGFDNFTVDDFARTERFDGEARYRLSEETTASFGLAGTHLVSGDMEFLGFSPAAHVETDLARAFAKIETRPEQDVSAYVQWFGNFTNMDQTSVASFDAMENDLEGQISASGKSNKLTVGGNVRDVYFDVGGRPTDLLAAENTSEQWAGLFATDRWQATHRLALEGQGRVDWYSEAGVDWSGRASSLYALDDGQHHIVRLTAAKSFRAPLLGMRDFVGTRLPAPPPLPAGMNFITFLPAPDMNNEEIYSAEAGYSGEFAHGLLLRADAYYQRMDDLIGAVSLKDPTDLGSMLAVVGNTCGANAYGFETELGLVRKEGQVSLWYSYHGFDLDEKLQSTRSFLPAEHQAGVKGQCHIGDGWTASAAYKFQSHTDNDPIWQVESVRSFGRFDLAIAKSLFHDKAELMVGIQDLFDDTRFGLLDDGMIVLHDTPGRLVFVRLQVRM